MEGSQVSGRCAIEGDTGTLALSSLSLSFLATMQWAASSTSWSHCRNPLPHHRPKINWITQGLKPQKPWEKVNISSFKLIFSSYFVLAMKIWQRLHVQNNERKIYELSKMDMWKPRRQCFIEIKVYSKTQLWKEVDRFSGSQYLCGLPVQRSLEITLPYTPSYVGIPYTSTLKPSWCSPSWNTPRIRAHTDFSLMDRSLLESNL